MQYIFIGLVLILGLIFYKIKKQIKEVNYLNDILYIQKEPEKYIDEMDKMLAVKQSEKNKIINTIQKTTGMLYAGMFNDVVETLEKFQSVPDNWMPIYYQNLILALYFKKDKHKANEEFKKAKTVFEKYRKNQYYNEFIEMVINISEFYNGKFSKEYFAELAETGANDYRKSFGYYFLGMINKKEKNSLETEENLAKAKEYGKGSFIEEFSAEK